MSERTLRQILQRLYEPHAGEPVAPAALEAQVMAAYDKRYAARRRFWHMPGSMRARTAMASVLLIALLGVACEWPTRAQVDMGQRIVVHLQSDASKSDGRALEKRVQQALVDAGAQNVRIVVDRFDDQRLLMDIVAWDEDLSPMHVEDILRDTIGADNLLTVNITTLSGTVSETLGRRMLRQFFGFDLDRGTAEELRAGILLRLAEQGFDGDNRVEVLDDGSVRKITVEAGTADGSREIADEVIIDRKDH